MIDGSEFAGYLVRTAEGLVLSPDAPDSAKRAYAEFEELMSQSGQPDGHGGRHPVY